MSRGKPHEQITGIHGRDVAEAERFGVSRRRGSRRVGNNGCCRAGRAPRGVWLRDGLAHQFVVLPVLAAGWRHRGLLPARRIGPMRDLSRLPLGQAGVAQKRCQEDAMSALPRRRYGLPSPWRRSASVRSSKANRATISYYRFVSVMIVPSRLMSTRLRKLMPSKAMGRLLFSVTTASTLCTATSPTRTVSSLRR